VQRFADVFNVKDFGALGNSSHDDTAAIQAAITAAQSAGGGIVFFPKGGYRITSRLTIQGVATNIILQGVGGDPQSGNTNGSQIFGDFNDWLLVFEPPQPGCSHIRDIGFANSRRNTTWPAGATTASGTPGCIYNTLGFDASIERCALQCLIAPPLAPQKIPMPEVAITLVSGRSQAPLNPAK
jgi:hypothetical protein